jgi:hypothetical protein
VAVVIIVIQALLEQAVQVVVEMALPLAVLELRQLVLPVQQTEAVVAAVVAQVTLQTMVAAALAALALLSSLTLAHKCLVVEQSQLLVATLFTHLPLAGLYALLIA